MSPYSPPPAIVTLLQHSKSSTLPTVNFNAIAELKAGISLTFLLGGHK
jgi:hypothetical protein